MIMKIYKRCWSRSSWTQKRWHRFCRNTEWNMLRYMFNVQCFLESACHCFLLTAITQYYRIFSICRTANSLVWTLWCAEKWRKWYHRSRSSQYLFDYPCVSDKIPQGAPQSPASGVPQSPATSAHHAGAVRLPLNSPEGRFIDWQQTALMPGCHMSSTEAFSSDANAQTSGALLTRQAFSIRHEIQRSWVYAER